MTQTLRPAAAPVSWGVTRSGSPFPWPQVLDEIRAAGFGATELGAPGFFPTNPTQLRTALAERDLTLTAAYAGLPLHDTHAFQGARAETLRLGRLLADIGARFIVLAADGDERRANLAGRVPIDGSAGLSTEQWRVAAHNLELLVRDLASLGLSAVFHHHAGTYVETADELATLCQLTDPALLGICLDTGHYLYGGGDPCEALATHGERIRYVHLKDIDADRLNEARGNGWTFNEAVAHGVSPALGSGHAKIAECVAILQARGYDGWVVVEQDVFGGRDAAGRTPLESMRAARTYLRRRGIA
jgi:inosose dehydratase